MLVLSVRFMLLFDDESLMGGKLQEQEIAGTDELSEDVESEDVENEYGIETSSSDEEHDSGIKHESESTVSDRYFNVTFFFSYSKSLCIC